MGGRSHPVRMMWAAYYQADGEMRFTIAIKKFQGAAEQEKDAFVARMSHPEVGRWWAWVEKIEEVA